jgi:predicted metal-binding transcription factor (methanogenesis marker protein 9)
MRKPNEGESSEGLFVSLIRCPYCQPIKPTPFALSTEGAVCMECAGLMSYEKIIETITQARAEIKKVRALYDSGLTPEESVRIAKGNYDA